jgi:hypothetical protein
MANGSIITTGSNPRLLMDKGNNKKTKDEKRASFNVKCAGCGKTVTTTNMKDHMNCNAY